MRMYDEKIDANSFNITIDGFPLIMEEISPDESFNRREKIRKNITGGTQSVMNGEYIVRDFSFTTNVRIDPLYPDIYNETFKLWMSKPVEVISKEFGGKFNAECIIKPVHETPSFLKLEIQLIEIPDVISNIPNDDFIVPVDQIISDATIATKKNNKKTTKKTNKKKKKKNKGGKITKTK